MSWLRAASVGEATPDAELFVQVIAAIERAQSCVQEVMALLELLQARAFDTACIAAFLTAVERARPAHRLSPVSAVNIVGTGGGPATINISTAAALVAAAAGACVLKSGSRSYRSACGSQNVLGALGIALPRSPRLLGEMLETFGVAFVSESHYGALFTSMAGYLPPQAVRQCMSPINRLGPWLSPYAVSGLMVGVSSSSLFHAYAALDGRLSLHNVLLVHSHSGLDELTPFAANDCYKFGSETGAYLLAASESASRVQARALADLVGGGPRENALRVEAICCGRELGHARDTVLMNAAQLLELAGVSPDIGSGQRLAEEAIDRGSVQRLLTRLRSWSARTFTRNVASPQSEVL
ncbi:MAG: anthranilate phosphoribosyltransferase [Pseudomonadota bacterium]|jgi:anthranilate phosphoribosyltransferase